MKEYFKPGATVLFQGDSITDAGRDYQNPADLGGGYPQKAAAIYQTLFPESGVRFVNRGVSGNRSADLLARYERDFKALQPDFISIPDECVAEGNLQPPVIRRHDFHSD